MRAKTRQERPNYKAWMTCPICSSELNSSVKVFNAGVKVAEGSTYLQATESAFQYYGKVSANVEWHYNCTSCKYTRLASSKRINLAYE